MGLGASLPSENGYFQKRKTLFPENKPGAPSTRIGYAPKGGGWVWAARPMVNRSASRTP
jgi:hypothetical protein